MKKRTVFPYFWHWDKNEKEVTVFRVYCLDKQNKTIVMKVNDFIRDLIMKQSNADQIRECAFEKNGRSLLKYGMNLVKNELTTIEEVERVCLLNDTQSEEL